MEFIEPIKFIYAADLRLDKPLTLEDGSGVSAARARGVAYEAVCLLIDCALSRGVDFVLLRGEIFDAYHSAKAPLFLAEQTARLSDVGIGCLILNEGPAPDAKWLRELSSGVKWFSRRSELEESGAISPASFLDAAPPPLLAGAWLVSAPEAPEGEYERELIEFDVLRVKRDGPDAELSETKETVQERSGLEEDFRSEAEFFKSGIDLRVGLLDALKERGLYKRLSAADAELLENMTEADAESILKDACGMAELLLRRHGAGPE